SLERRQTMRVAIIQDHQGSCFVFCTPGRIVGPKSNRTIDSELKTLLRNLEFLFRRRAARQNTNQRRVGARLLAGIFFMHFQINCAGRPGLDSPGMAMNNTSEMGGSSCDREAWLRIFKQPGRNAMLPLGDLFYETLTQRVGREG